ncbi:DMT family transporter [Clostridium felsineum]|uniref:EamA family transporter n=1 Tax=Clostridium felsineum TaxID=36839 RepID=UPI00098CC840
MFKSCHYPILVFLGGCCYGILSTFVNLAYLEGFSPSQVTESQYFCGTVLIWCDVLFTKKKKLNLKQILKIMLCGIPFGLTGIFYYQSLKTLNTSLAIIFLFQFVWIGVLFDWIFNKKKPWKQKLVSIIILLIGSILAANLLTQRELNFSLKGIIWGMLAAISYTTFIFFSSSVEKDTPPILKSALLSTSALIIIFLLFPPILFSIGMPHIEPALGTILPSSELPFATIMSSLFLSEYVSLPQWFGAIPTFLGIIVSNVVYERKAVEA